MNKIDLTVEGSNQVITFCNIEQFNYLPKSHKYLYVLGAFTLILTAISIILKLSEGSESSYNFTPIFIYSLVFIYFKIAPKPKVIIDQNSILYKSFFDSWRVNVQDIKAIYIYTQAQGELFSVNIKTKRSRRKISNAIFASSISEAQSLRTAMKKNKKRGMGRLDSSTQTIKQSKLHKLLTELTLKNIKIVKKRYPESLNIDFKKNPSLLVVIALTFTMLVLFFSGHAYISDEYIVLPYIGATLLVTLLGGLLVFGSQYILKVPFSANFSTSLLFAVILFLFTKPMFLYLTEIDHEKVVINATIESYSKLRVNSGAEINYLDVQLPKDSFHKINSTIILNAKKGLFGVYQSDKKELLKKFGF